MIESLIAATNYGTNMYGGKLLLRIVGFMIEILTGIK
jgi:hypothetical protein